MPVCSHRQEDRRTGVSMAEDRTDEPMTTTPRAQAKRHVDGLTDRRVTKARDRKPEIARTGVATIDNGAFPDGLTKRQNDFVNAIVAGKSQTDAYLMSYNATGTRETATTASARLAADAKIASAIARRVAEKEDRTQHSSSFIKRHVVDGMMKLTESPNENIRLRALDRLGHIAGVDLYRDKPASKPLDELGSRELEARLMERLRLSLAIDVTPIPEGE